MPDINNTLNFIQALANEWRNDEIIPYLKMLEQDLDTWEKKSFIEDVSDYFEHFKDRLAWNIGMEVIPTWFNNIDKRIYWAAKWEIMTICASTWWWKTTFGLNIALNMLEEHNVGFISLEMTKEDIIDKIMSRECNIRHSCLIENKFNDYAINNIKAYWAKAKEKADKLVMAFNCFNLEDVVNTIEEMVDRWCEAIFVDWIWMINAPGSSRPEKINTIMCTLKEVATKYKICIIAMQQLNRQIYSMTREDPNPGDVADGSAVEKISSPLLIMRRSKDSQKDETIVSMFKRRRMNSVEVERCKEMEDKLGIPAMKLFTNVKLKNDLWHCQFVDSAEEFITKDDSYTFSA